MTINTASYLEQINALFAKYIERYPEDAERLSVLTGQLKRHDQTLNDRKNMIGHLTGSALVVDEQNRCLLIYHRFLKRWLQPGGHLDAGEMPDVGAARELKEETGMSDVTFYGENFPIDIDSHKIPPSSAKQEGEHLHHDFQYIFKPANQESIDLDQSEVADFKWVSLEDLATGEYGQRLARVAGKLMTGK